MHKPRFIPKFLFHLSLQPDVIDNQMIFQNDDFYKIKI